jgi:hypothetical protein
MLSSGLVVEGLCGLPTNVELVLRRPDKATTLQASGTLNRILGVFPVDVNGGSQVSSNSPAEADIDVDARDTRKGGFARIDIHASRASSCSHWGVTIPTG